MQRDSHLTLREIHGSIENLVSGIADIQERALVQVAEDDAPLNLRLITPYRYSEDWSTDENCCEYALTSQGHLGPGQEYISVSYTWAHSQKVDESSVLPDYRVSDQATPDAPFRPIKCPAIVFHRAFCFARARNIPYVWIDQECIYQDDAEDKERHLRIMHRIYRDSRWTVAILSNEMPNTMLGVLSLVAHEKYRDADCSQYGIWPAGIDVRPLLKGYAGDFTIGLASILSDRWFTRAWTFQEKYCASACVLLIPLERRGNMPTKLPFDWIGNDGCFSFRSCRDLARLTCPEESNTEDWLLKLRSVIAPLAPFLHEMDPSSCLTYSLQFELMEKCDNLVCSDRLTIFANVCRYRYKLNSTMLNDARYSYSTCILALVMANKFDDKGRAEVVDIWELDLDKSILQAVQWMDMVTEG